MRSLLGRFHRPMSRGLVNNMLTMNNLGDGSTLSLDFTTMGGVLDPRLTFTRSTTATYINSSGYITSAAINAPRFDYSPTNIGQPRGLLIEAGATNIIPHSNAFTSGSWYTGGVPAVLTSNYAVGPDGVTGSAWRFSAQGPGFPNNSVFATPVSNGGAAHLVSIYAKSNTGSNQTFYIYNGSSGTNCTATNVWQRFQVSVAGTWPYAYFGTVGTNQDILIYGAQSEVGASDASSYIPTDASQVTRAVDTAIIAAGTNFSSWYTGGTTGTFVSNWYGSASSSTARSVIATSDVDDKHLHLYQTASALTLRLADFGALATVTTANNLTANALTKGAFSYAGTATSLCLNGGTVATNTLGFSVAPTFLSIGGPSTTGTTITDTSVMLNNSIRTIKYYPTRLTDAQIKEITT